MALSFELTRSISEGRTADPAHEYKIWIDAGEVWLEIKLEDERFTFAGDDAMKIVDLLETLALDYDEVAEKLDIAQRNYL